MSSTTETPSSYTGSCHCGQVKYSFTLPGPIEEQEVHECNCSICQIHGYLLIYPLLCDTKIEHDEDAVKEYKFASKKISHYFCTNCGTSIYGTSCLPGYSDKVAVNVRTVKGIEIESLNIKKVDGRSLFL
ncbi:Mss4-like protein, partial [Aspergillus floccosus]